MTAGRGAVCCADTPRVQAVSRRRASVMIASVAPPGAALARCPDVAPAQRWRVARTLPRRVTAGRGAVCCADTPRVQAVSRRRASVMIASVAPPGATLARCPDVAPAQRWRVARTLPRRVTAGRGAHCCADTPRVQAVSRRRASVMIASVAPPGAALARCPDIAPVRDRRQGAHCCAGTP
ncbi:hypothetical protein JYY74_004228 [Salmonella enterica subsp. enterica serovar Enteritidis]|nr:hypothetical protein [Salmonella enterica subsp. enterica serovar Enteritidis]